MTATDDGPDAVASLQDLTSCFVQIVACQTRRAETSPPSAEEKGRLPSDHLARSSPHLNGVAVPPRRNEDSGSDLVASRATAAAGGNEGKLVASKKGTAIKRRASLSG